MPKELSIIMPVYNEEGIIENVLRKWSSEIEKLNIPFEICVYNDGSKDNSANILEMLKNELSNIVVINKSNSGHGPTILKGYLDHLDSKWVFQVDSDDEMGPEWFKELWVHNERYDFIVGRRYGRKKVWPRYVTSLISRITIRALYGSGVKDVNCPYRLMRVEKFKKCYQSIPKDTFAPNIIITGFASLHNFQSAELDVPQRDRRTGELSIKEWKLLKVSLLSFMQTINYRFNIYPKLN